MKHKTGVIARDRLDGALRRESVKKNVAAIHVSGKLTLLQRKLSNVLLLNAYDNLASRAAHRIDARTLCLMIGYNSNDQDTLKASLRSLAETICEWDMLDEDGKQEWGVSALLSYAKLKGGVCEYAYSPLLAEKLHDPKIFALINLDIQRRFTSGHALALYENCYRFVRTGSTGWWDIDLFRRLMGVDDSDYYAAFKHLNAKIVKPAVAEVNRSSNIALTPQTRRQGRAVSAIRFLIEPNAKFGLDAPADRLSESAAPVLDKLLKAGVSERLARQWIAEHGAAYVARKLDYMSDQGDAVRSPVSYLSAAIKGDFGADTRAGQVGEAAPITPDHGAERAERARERIAQEARSQDLSAQRRLRDRQIARVVAASEARNPTQRDADRRAFLTRLSSDVQRDDFLRNGWRSGICVTFVIAFWKELIPEIFDDLA